LSGRRLLAWVLLAAWTVWAVALQSLFAAAMPAHFHFVPELAPVILLVLASRLETRDLPPAALVVALARSACGLEPPAAVLFGLLVLAGILRALRGVLELDGPATRATVAGAAAFALALWFDLVHGMRLGQLPAAPAWSALLPVALASSLAALVLAPLLRRLPGLSPLFVRRRSAW
jgi:hypothetical protein